MAVNSGDMLDSPTGAAGRGARVDLDPGAVTIPQWAPSSTVAA